MCSQEPQQTILKTRILIEVVEEERELGARVPGTQADWGVPLLPARKVMFGLFLAQDLAAGITHEDVEAPQDEEVEGEEDVALATLRSTLLRELASGIFPI